MFRISITFECCFEIFYAAQIIHFPRDIAVMTNKSTPKSAALSLYATVPSHRTELTDLGQEESIYITVNDKLMTIHLDNV